MKEISTSFRFFSVVLVLLVTDLAASGELLSDSRINRISELPPQHQELAQSVAIMVPKDSLVPKNKGWIIQPKMTLGSKEAGIGFCKGESFTDQWVYGECSGVLVADDLLVLAGHCFPEQKGCQGDCANPAELCSRYSFVFGIENTAGAPQKDRVLGENDVYDSCELLYQNYRSSDRNETGWSNGIDLSVVRLSKKDNGRRPVVSRRLSGQLKPGDKVITMGSPRGTPLVSSSGQVQALLPHSQSNSEVSRVKAAMWNSPGLSGAPVFDEKSGRLEGIFTGGGYTLFYDEAKECYRWIDPDDPSDPKDSKNFGPLDPNDSGVGQDVHSRFIPMPYINSVIERYLRLRPSPGTSSDPTEAVQ